MKRLLQKILADMQQQIDDSPESDVVIDCKDAEKVIDCLRNTLDQHQARRDPDMPAA